MLKAYCWFRQMVERQEGQGMTEYGLIIALVAVVLISVLTGMGKGLTETFTKICSAVTGGSCPL
jgi:pilus assembly protein Flp/PilA